MSKTLYINLCQDHFENELLHNNDFQRSAVMSYFTAVLNAHVGTDGQINTVLVPAVTQYSNSSTIWMWYGLLPGEETFFFFWGGGGGFCFVTFRLIRTRISLTFTAYRKTTCTFIFCKMALRNVKHVMVPVDRDKLCVCSDPACQFPTSDLCVGLCACLLSAGVKNKATDICLFHFSA